MKKAIIKENNYFERLEIEAEKIENSEMEMNWNYAKK